MSFLLYTAPWEIKEVPIKIFPKINQYVVAKVYTNIT